MIPDKFHYLAVKKDGSDDDILVLFTCDRSCTVVMSNPLCSLVLNRMSRSSASFVTPSCGNTRLIELLPSNLIVAAAETTEKNQYFFSPSQKYKISRVFFTVPTGGPGETCLRAITNKSIPSLRTSSAVHTRMVVTLACNVMARRPDGSWRKQKYR